MSYPKEHTDDDCDRCLKLVGKDNLREVPFKYLDKNDSVHPDCGGMYRQYYVCKGWWGERW